MYNAIICRYHEIAIKGNNRIQFERCLMENLHWLFDAIPVKVQRIRGRVWIEKKDGGDFSEAEMALAHTYMHKAFGVESYSPARLTKPDIDAIRSALDQLAPMVFEPRLAQSKSVSFRIRARRSDKNFAMRSKEIEIDLATRLGERYGDDRLDIDLDNGEITVGVEVRDEVAILFFDTLRGPGGLPVGSNARVLALLSGGIDSPVACYLTMKRGSPVDYLTFHSAPYTPPDTTEKVTGIAAFLNTFQRPAKLHLCNLAPMQKAIRDKCCARFRTVLYRRMMFRIAAMVARKTNCEALLTGEALGQVASQTVVNMATINAAVDMLVLRPLVGQDKLETIRWAEQIGSFELSKVQVPDSCTVFAPDHPATAAPLELILEEENKLGDFLPMLEEIVAAIETLRPGAVK